VSAAAGAAVLAADVSVAAAILAAAADVSFAAVHMQMAVRDRRMSDDVSIIIADLLPPATPGATPQQFPAAALKVRAGMPCCFAAEILAVLWY
jgi:hypothetical protein